MSHIFNHVDKKLLRPKKSWHIMMGPVLVVASIRWKITGFGASKDFFWDLDVSLAIFRFSAVSIGILIKAKWTFSLLPK